MSFLRLSITSLVLFSTLLSLTWAKDVVKQRSYDYEKMFALTRETLIGRPVVKQFLRDVFVEALKEEHPEIEERLKEISESQFMALLSRFPEAWPKLEEYLKKIPGEVDPDNERQKKRREEFRTEFKEMFEDKDAVEVFLKIVDPLEPFFMRTKDGSPGLTYREVYFTHPSNYQSKTLPATSFDQELISFLKNPKLKRAMGNVFECDSEDLADAMIEAHKRGVEGLYGVDKNRVEGPDAPEGNKKIYKKLKEAGVNVVLVDPVGLNHQKILIGNWDIPEEAIVILESANWTNSCCGTNGDLTGLEDQLKNPKDIKKGKANANNMTVIKSHHLALLVHHKLTQTLVMKLRGSEGPQAYPLGGSFKILGANNTSYTFVTSPRGALGNIMIDIYAKVIRDAPDDADFHLMTFAFSSDELEQALFEKAKKHIAMGKKTPRIFAIGDRPFAVAEWSGYLSMSGYKKDEKTGNFIEDKENKWYQLLGEEGMALFRKQLLVSPDYYREMEVPLKDGTSVKTSVKIHHKVITVGNFTTLGDSHNLSQAAKDNQEQGGFWDDPYMADRARGAQEWLATQTNLTVHDVVLKRISFMNGGIKEKMFALGRSVKRKLGFNTCPEALADIY